MSPHWYLRREGGDIYGPSSLSELKSWAKKGLIGPNDDLSQDQETWQAAPMLKDLEMVWSIEVEENLIFGPFNIYALIELAEENHLSYAADTVDLRTGKHHSLGDVLLPLLYTERESLVEHTRQEMDEELVDARRAVESLRHELNAREEDLKTITLQLQNKVKEQTQLAEKGMNHHQALLMEREQAVQALQSMEQEIKKLPETLKEKDAEIAQLEDEVNILKTEVIQRDEQMRELRDLQEDAGLPGDDQSDGGAAQNPAAAVPGPAPVSGDALEIIEKLKDDLANARAAIHYRDVEITRLKNASGARQSSLVSQAMAKNLGPDQQVGEDEPGLQAPMALQTALSGIRRETLKDSKKKSQAAASYKRQRAAAKQEATSRKAAKGGSTSSRRK